MTKEQLDALIEFVRDMAYAAVNDPTSESRIAREAEQRIRAAFEPERST